MSKKVFRYEKVALYMRIGNKWELQERKIFYRNRKEPSRKTFGKNEICEALFYLFVCEIAIKEDNILFL